MHVFFNNGTFIFEIMNSATPTKLTLVLENYIVQSAKEYARAQGTSISKLVENYFYALTKKRGAQKSSIREITPFVAKLKAGITLPADFDYREDIAEYLEEKYK
ncbi:hypothetical protein AGMMS4956_21100 [Bacteroidia bacterium]|nr:hypothetical protein AGMMS4956_21100 [Bacteroidia bacterium]